MRRRYVAVTELAARGVFVDLSRGGVVSSRELVGRPVPIEVDLGCGRGHFLVAAARARPDTLFLGVEKAYRYALLAADRIARAGTPNARVLCMDALDALRLAFPPRSVRALHVYFPDPWPKRRHHKRRLFRPPFARAAARVVRPGGGIHLLTDHEEIYALARSLLDLSGAFAAQPFPEDVPGRPWSAYERKWRAAGRPILGARWMRRGRSG